tara:strand:- start:2632 stop:2874 length:243 start_codon:yes stop_codon:yes gene_type:complete
MLNVISFVRYSKATLMMDSNFLFGVIIFFLLCGILIFQNLIWEEEDCTKNQKWLKWKESAIKSNKTDLSNIYPITKDKTS